MTDAWLDGRLVPAEAACISPFDRGFTLGDGVFETIPIHGGRPFDLDAHLARLAAGLAILGFADAVDVSRLRSDIRFYVAQQALAIAVLRVTVTRGGGPRGLAPPADPRPTVLMTLSPPPPPRDAPVTAVIATATRRNEMSPISRIKALPYLDNLVALREARAKGAEEALLLNTQGAVACATIANVFVVRGDRLVTPPVTDGALPGTMRAILLALAAEAGAASCEERLDAEALATADHVFLSNSVRGIVEVGEIDGRPQRRDATPLVLRLRELVAGRIAAQCG